MHAVTVLPSSCGQGKFVNRLQVGKWHDPGAIRSGVFAVVLEAYAASDIANQRFARVDRQQR